MQNKTQIGDLPRHFKVKLNFSFWPNWTRPDLPFAVNFLTQPDPRVGQESCNLTLLHRNPRLPFPLLTLSSHAVQNLNIEPTAAFD